MAKRIIENGVFCWLCFCVAAFVFVSRSWPLTSDASLMHYVVFLMRHGMQPYRDIVEMNLPGSYLLEGIAMSAFGPDSTGCRLYDLTLLALSSFSLVVILRPYGRLAAFLGASLFILVHGRDGPLMTAERDLATTAFLLSSVAMLFTFFRKDKKSSLANALPLFIGVSSGIALTIKPTLLPLAAGLFLWIAWSLREQRILLRRSMSFFAVGAMLPLGWSLIFLVRHQAVKAFWGELHGLIPYHASLGNHSIGYLLNHSISPLLPMLFLWLPAAYLLRRQTLSPERIALILCAVCGLLSYLLQGKAFWYQRYPFLAFVVPLFVADFATLLRGRVWQRIVGIAGMATGIVIATGCLVHLRKYDRTEPPRQVLRDLAALGTPETLSGHVQCIDTIGGCIDALYAARIVQSTGFLYDCYMLDGGNPVALDLRRRFWQQMERNPPKVIVMTDSNCYAERRSFDRFGKWPEFRQYLDTNYALARESGALPPIRYWSHPMEAYQYRIFVRR
jgi:hypothetical protein